MCVTEAPVCGSEPSPKSQAKVSGSLAPPGSVAVAVALVSQGPLVALLVVLAVIAVQQVEGNLLQPLVMGRALHLHPAAVVVAVALGASAAGVIGAVVAVPVVAVATRLAEQVRDRPA